MEEQNQNLGGGGSNSRSDPMPEMTEKPKWSKLWKFATWFVVVIIVAVAGLWAIGDYEEKRGIKAFEEWAESTKRSFEEFEARKAADTYGGATPQETLRMYIEAVEKGDYELASKYFVLDRQEQTKTGFEGASKENIQKYLDTLRQALSSEGSYSSKKDTYGIHVPVLIEFKLYPSDIWKIVEI